MTDIFKLRENNTTVATELRAGVVTFLTMSYIIFFQPSLLSQTGLSWNSVFVATCVASAAATILMAFFANYPVALAPAMGHNVLFWMLCQNGTINWQTGFGVLMISGTLFILLSFWGLREKIVTIIPSSIKHGIAVGIGLLIAFIGFQWTGLVVASPGTLVKIGNLHSPPVLLAIGGLTLTALLVALRLRGAILIGIVVTALVGIPLGITNVEQFQKEGLFHIPHAEPMEKVAILPVAVSQDVKVDAAAVISALETAGAKYYEKDKVLSPAEIRTQLEALGESPGPEMSADSMLALGRDVLRAPVLVLPVVEQVENADKEKETVLRAIAYTTEHGEAHEKKYYEVPLPASAEKLSSYARDVMVGLPGHNALLGFDIVGALKIGLLDVIFVFFFLDLFDTIGTLIGVAEQAGFLRNGKLPRARGALLADACGTVIGASLGTSTISSYIESSAGVADGARTGLANLVTALLFLLALFFTPVIQMIGGRYHAAGGVTLYPSVAPVLIIIGSIMLRNVVHITWTDATEALPAFLAIMVMPLTFSITDGIAVGFIMYCFLKLATGRGREADWLMYLFAVLFIARYVFMKAA